MKKTIIIILSALITQALFSQNLTQTVLGKIVDSQTEAPLAGVTVIISTTSPVLGDRTDAEGNFRIEKVPIGRQTIAASCIGYLPNSQANIFITSTKESFLEIKLEESVTSLGEVFVTTKLRKDESINKIATVSARTFSIEETERYSGSIGDPARMASNFAGIATICDQRNDIIIRGNSPLGVLWRLDGIDIPNPNHFSSFGASGGPISILNNNLLTNSDFFTGAFPAEYGNALSGVFDLKMRSGSNQKYEFILQAGMNGFEIGAEGPIVKDSSSFLINYRYSTLAVVDALGFNVGIDAIPFYQDASFKIASKYTKFGRFSLIGIGGYSHVNEFDSGKDTSELLNGKGEDYTFGSGMGSVGLIHKLLINNINIENSISASYIISRITEDRFSIQPPEHEIYYRQQSDEKGITFSTNLKHKINPKNVLQTGISFQMLQYRFADSVKNGGTFKVNIDQKGNYNLLKSYIQVQHKFTDFLVGYSGLHFLLFTFNNKYSVEPRLGLKWSFNPHQSLNFGFGLHSQLAPRMFYIVESESSPGNPDPLNQKLGFSKSMHVILGYNWLLSDNLRLKSEAYYQHLYNIPVKEGNPVYSILNFGDNYFNQLPIIDSLINNGTGKNYGIELTIEKFLDKGYYALVTTSLYESKYKGFDGIDRNFILNVLAGKEFRIGKSNFFSFNLKTTYAGSLRYVPYEIEQVSPNYFVQNYDWDNAYQNRRKNYFRLNGRFGYKLIREKFYLEVAIDFMNITNHRDIFMENFNSGTGEVEYSYQFPFLPIGVLRIQF
jgi:hypothetical protein